MKDPTFLKFYLPQVTDQYLGPNGKLWHLGLADDGKGLLFLDGWKEFARENNLKVGYLLLFTYHGNLKFTVLAFDTSGCNILGGSNAPKNNAVPAHPHSSNIPMGGLQSAGGQTSREKYEQHYKEWKVKCSKRNVWRPSYRAQSNLSAMRKPNQRQLKKGEIVLILRHLSGCTGADLTRQSGALISQRRSVSEEEKERAFEKAKSLVLENPSVLIILRPSQVYFGFFMVFPYKFITRWLPRETCEMIVWDPAGRRFIIKFVNTGKRMCGLSAGWKLFCIANNLEEDDVCVFELIKEKELQVHIFRVVEEITPSINNVLRKLRRPMDRVSLPQYDGHVENKMKKVKCSVTTKVDLRRQLQLDEAKEKTGEKYYHRFTSKFPYFLVQLTKSSVGHHGALIEDHSLEQRCRLGQFRQVDDDVED
ncbi:hypothetical protein ACLOJK_001743 [Asimina triloba]